MRNRTELGTIQSILNVDIVHMTLRLHNPKYAFKMTAPIAKWKMDWEEPKGILSVLFCIYGPP